MPRANFRIPIQRENALADILEHEIAVRTPKIGAPHAALKEGVPRQEHLGNFRGTVFVKPNAKTTRTMTRRMDHREAEIADLEPLFVLKIMIDRQRHLVFETEEGALHLKLLIKRLVGAMKGDLRAACESLLHLTRGTDVVQVTVGLKEVFDLDGHARSGLQTLEALEDRSGFITWVDQHGLPGAGAGEQAAVALERAYDPFTLKHYEASQNRREWIGWLKKS